MSVNDKITKTIEIYKEIYSDNDKLAAKISSDLKNKNISMFNILGTPGCGKTTFLTNSIKYLNDKKVLVIEGDVESDIDTANLKKIGIDAFQINTHGGCHLDAVMMEKALNSINDKDLDVIFIENVGNLICTAEYYLGEKKIILIASTTEGSDKPYKYPHIFEIADAIVINKSDLIPYLNFDEDFFMKGVRFVNKKAPIFKLSSINDENFSSYIDWLKQSIKE
jgi:hydrogenase nickel incorporation protein HypB